MKKFKLSLAILAIVVATASAFTTASPLAIVFKANADQSAGSATNPAVYELDVTSQVNATPYSGSLAAFAADRCEGATPACVAKIENGIVTQSFNGQFQ